MNKTEQVAAKESRIGGLERLLLGLVVVLIVLAIALQIQVSSRNRDIGKVRHAVAVIEQAQGTTKAAAQDAKKASESAEQVLKEAIAAGKNSPIDPQAIADGLAAIKRIEAKLNGK